MSAGMERFDNALCTALSKRANTRRPFAGFVDSFAASAIRKSGYERTLGFMKKVGILVGRERTFPEALIRNVNERGNGSVVAEYINLGGGGHDGPPAEDSGTVHTS